LDHHLYFIDQNGVFGMVDLITLGNLIIKEKNVISILEKSFYNHIELNNEFVVIGSKV